MIEQTTMLAPSPRGAPSVTLRDYQAECIEKIWQAWESGIHCPLVELPTGAGKTVIFNMIIYQFLQKFPYKRVLVLAHRKELVEQADDKFRRFIGSGYNIGIIAASINRWDFHGQIIFASKDSIQNHKRIAQMLAYGEFGLVVTDEAHHAVAKTYTTIFNALSAVNPELWMLGVSATLERADGLEFGDIFTPCPWNENGLAYSIDLPGLLKGRYLTIPRYLIVKTGVSLKGIKKTAGDYNQNQLSHRFETPEVFAMVVKAHLENAGDRQAVAFTVSVLGAKALAELFNTRGITAASIDGSMAKEDRERILASFETGEIRVLCNCAVLTEGYDYAGIEAVHMIRPTENKSLSKQCFGRGLRPRNGRQAEEGEDCLIFLYAPLGFNMLAKTGYVLGLSDKDQAQMEKAQKGLNQIEMKIEDGGILAGFAFSDHIEMAGLGIDGLTIIAREVNYLEETKYLWYKDQDGSGWLTLGLGIGKKDGIERILAISPRDADGNHTLYTMGRRDWNTPWSCHHHSTGTFEKITETANDIAGRYALPVLSEKNKSWMRGPASIKQIGFLEKLARKAPGKNTVPAGITAGQAAELINYFQAMIVLKSKGVEV